MSTRSTRRPSRKFSDRERAFVINAYPALGPAEIARKLGRSKSGVCSLIAQLKRAGEISAAESADRRSQEPPPAELDEGEGQDTIGRLRRLRALLERQMYDAGPAQVARIAAEYRAVVDEIDKRENRGDGGDDDVLGRLADALAGKPRGA